MTSTKGKRDVKFFMYHDIRDTKEYKNRYNLKSFLTIQEFKNQLEYIGSEYNIISTQEYLELGKKHGKYAILTFDDGLLDHFYVSKILKNKGLKGTFLIPTKCVRDGYIIQSHKIQFILSEVAEKDLVTNILSFIPESKEQLFLKYGKSNFKNNWWTNEMVFITNILRQHCMGREITNKLFSLYITDDFESFNKTLYIDETHIHEMLNDGMEIGGHGFVSENMLLMGSDEMKSDIKNTCDHIKTFIKDNPLFYSYPNGGYNSCIVEELRKNNCVVAYTTKPNNNLADNLKLPRISAPEELPR